MLEQFLSIHNSAVEEKKCYMLGKVTVTDNNDYISYSNSDYSVMMDAIREKLINTHGGYLLIRYEGNVKYLDYLADDSYTSVTANFPAVPFLVKVSISDLNIRTGAGTNYEKTGKYTGKRVFTITEVRSGSGSTLGWGKLKSGAGWIALDHCEKV